MNDTFFLGGHDLEMLTIRSLVAEHRSPGQVIDHHLPWHNAKASAYQSEIIEVLDRGDRAVLIELEADIEQASQCLLIDHHGARAGEDVATSLEQVFALLSLPNEHWSRDFQLIAANDRGWIPELRAMGASDEEIDQIRMLDRQAQGIEAWQEQAALDAIRKAEWLEPNTVLVTLSHSKTAPVTDHLAIVHETPPDTMILSPDEVNFSGNGARAIRLDRAYPGGWLGGALPDFGFWGRGTPLPSRQDLLSILIDR